MNILDEYVMKAPSVQNIIDLFKGEWSSLISDRFESGHADLFNDGRINMMEKIIGGFENK